MIAGRLIHPPLLAALGAAGHGATVLLCDGHYPATTAVGPNAERVHLNLAPGLLDTSAVLDVLLDALPVEAAAVMVPPHGPDPAAVAGHRARLAQLEGVQVRALQRQAFYDAARGPDLAVVVVTGDVRQYANLLLVVGVRGVSAVDSAAGTAVR